MIPEIDKALLAVGSSLAASAVTKATVALALALIAAGIARNSRAAARHAMLAAAFAALVALPVAALLAPPVRIAVPVASRKPLARSGPSVIAAPVGAVAGATSTAPQSPAFLLTNLIFAGWLAGAALFALPMMIGLLRVRSLRRSGLPWPDGQTVTDRLALPAGIRRRVEVLTHQALPGPMTCGIVRPAICLPQDAQNWDEEDLNRALVHELEHVRRGDWAGHCLARAVCAVYWFHPLAWIAWRQLALEAERACDDAVLEQSEATVYADQLVKLARRLSAAAKSPIPAMANRADLTKRVGAVLDSRRRRGRAGALPVALACAAAVALVLTLSPLRMVAAQQSPAADSGVKVAGKLSVGTNLVIETVTVSGRNGDRIEGLQAGDFSLTEDGVAQTISIFEFQKVDAGLSYYVLGYYTSNPSVDGRFRKVQIALRNNAGATLDYRPGYYADKVFTRLGGAPRAEGTQTPSPTEHTASGPPPRLIRKVEPAYSEEARKAKFQGHVVLDVEVDTSGNVVNPRVMRSLGLGLDEKAIEAVSQWKFMPGMKDGSPVSVNVEVEVDFRLL